MYAHLYVRHRAVGAVVLGGWLHWQWRVLHVCGCSSATGHTHTQVMVARMGACVPHPVMMGCVLC